MVSSIIRIPIIQGLPNACHSVDDAGSRLFHIFATNGGFG
jgi:hypothetical protein